MGIYLHASVRLLPACLSCLNQRLGSAKSALSPSYKGTRCTNAWWRVTFTARWVSDCHCKQRAHINTHTQVPTTSPGRQSQVILKQQHWCPFLPQQWLHMTLVRILWMSLSVYSECTVRVCVWLQIHSDYNRNLQVKEDFTNIFKLYHDISNFFFNCSAFEMQVDFSGYLVSTTRQNL